MERSDDLSHSLVPLELAVLLVREKVYRANPTPPEGNSDPDAIATFIASAVPIYEYTDDLSIQPRTLMDSYLGGVFRKAGRELHFDDGRPMKYKLAVQADDIACVVAMLKEPERAAEIRALRRKGGRPGSR